MKDAVGVDVESDFDLGNAAGGRRDAIEIESPQALVLVGHGPFALQDMDLYAGLAIAGRGEGLRFLGRDGRIGFDKACHDAAHRLDTQRKRGHVEQQHVFDLTGQYGALDRAPIATTSSGFTLLLGFLPKNFSTIS